MSAVAPTAFGAPSVHPAPRWRRILSAWSRPGDAGRWTLLAAGLLLDLLWLPPGLLGLHVPALVFVADAPLLLLVWHGGGARWKRWAFLYGLLHFALALHWLLEVGWFQWVGAFAGLAPVTVLLGAALRWGARRRVPFVPLVGAAVVLEELVRTVWLGGMPWPQHSLAFVGWPTLCAAAALAGAYGLSFLAGMTSALAVGLFGVWRAAPEHRPVLLLRWFGSGLVAAAWALLLLLHGAERVGGYRPGLASGRCRQTPPLLVVQGDVPQSLKHAGGSAAANLIFNRHLALTRAGLLHAGREPRLVLGVLWPETMVPWPFTTPDLARRFPEAWDNAGRIASRLRAALPGERLPHSLFVGAIHHFAERPEDAYDVLDDYGDHDSLLWIDPQALPRPEALPLALPPAGTALLPWERGRHDKVVRVPGGEYTPGSGWLPFLKVWRDALSAIPEIAPGAPDQEPFEIWLSERTDARGELESRPVKAGTVICFEIAFPQRCRAWRRAGCHVLFNPSNYGWFGPTAFRAQIRAVAALRAAELGQTVVMAGNTGPTVCYSPLGEAYGTFHPQPLDADGNLPEPPGAPPGPPGPAPGTAPGADETTFQSGWILEPLYADDAVTLYTSWGDLPWLALGAVLLLGGLVRRRMGPDAPRGPVAPEGGGEGIR